MNNYNNLYKYKYLKYKNKYNYIKKYKNNLNGFIQKGGLLIKGKEYLLDTTYILSESDICDIKSSFSSSLSDEYDDIIGFSDAHPNFWFKITSIEKHKELKVKLFNFKIHVVSGDLLIQGKEFTPGITYILSGPGEIQSDIVVNDSINILTSINIDEIGFSEVYPNFWFEITPNEKHKEPYAKLYNFKIHIVINDYDELKSIVNKEMFKLKRGSDEYKKKSLDSTIYNTLEDKIIDLYKNNMKTTYKLAYEMLNLFPMFVNHILEVNSEQANKRKAVQDYKEQLRICQCLENFVQACVKTKDNLKLFPKVLQSLNNAHELILNEEIYSLRELAISCIFGVCNTFPSDQLVNFIFSEDEGICHDVISIGSGWGILETALSLSGMNVTCIDPNNKFTLLPTINIKGSQYDFASRQSNFCIMFPFPGLSSHNNIMNENGTCDLTCTLIRAVASKKCVLVYTMMDSLSIDEPEQSAVGTKDFHSALTKLKCIETIRDLKTFQYNLGLVCCRYIVLPETLANLKTLFTPEEYPNYQSLL